MGWASAGLQGTAGIVRLSASLLDRTDRHCADFAAVKARPGLWPPPGERRRFAPWEEFPLGLVMRALDAAEFDGADVDEAVSRVLETNRSPVHPGAAVWVRHACHAYMAAGKWIADELGDVAVVPQRHPRVVQSGSAAELRMLTAWGRWYESPDGSVREFRRLRMSRIGEAEAPSVAAISFVAAAGRRAVGNVYRDAPVQVIDDERAPTRIRVVEVMLDDDVVPRVLVDATPEEVRRRYRNGGMQVAQRIVAGGDRRPGAECVECKLRASCDELPYVPGLLGLGDAGTHRRTWSVTTGRQYLVCPAQAQMRELRLPADRFDGGPAARRGVVVHQWLELAHRRGRACGLVDLPEPDAADIGIAAQVMTAEEYREARPYLLAHLAVCPLAGPGRVTDLMVEPSVAAYDPVADVVVIADPDLVRRVDGRVVYREQKTTAGAVPAGGPREVFSRVPQLALAVLLIRQGVFGRDGDGVVELEVMTPAGAAVHAFGVADPAVVGAAREEVARMVTGWHRDVAFRARPGHWCARCPVARWCPDRSEGADPDAPIEVDGARIDPRTGEVLDGPVSGRAAAVSAVISEPVADEDIAY
ncbi:hypothetical protein Acsp04_47390 [Actinomadura sp. NBRC 104425]|uniref:PD-(D/E)XK nuclease family protein n=1 Tax=Actinomadura sp. NBRC 104425 TaxID=3032204 RepID=UPI0024A59C91|nr:PD-(D/E)XK nuclease family protein [Actinomadura sp. NBRC 104425]GLZ14504.1 hypothetical protein Acsp04_47390 [Actinomadura sp. NBRC 104425]